MRPGRCPTALLQLPALTPGLYSATAAPKHGISAAIDAATLREGCFDPQCSQSALLIASWVSGGFRKAFREWQRANLRARAYAPSTSS